MAKTVQYYIKPHKKSMASASGRCVQQASIYGRCILQSFTDNRKDPCEKELQLFNICVSKHLK